MQVSLGRFDIGVIDRCRVATKGAAMSVARDLHFEKGRAFIGHDTSTPVDMSKPEYQGLEDVIQKRGITAGDYRWDVSDKTLTPAAGSGGRVS